MSDLVKVNLRSTLVFSDGSRLGPGEVEMDREQAEKRGLLKPEPAAAAEPKPRKPRAKKAAAKPEPGDEG